MPKPQWLKDKESGLEKIERVHKKCFDCAYRGKPFKMTTRYDKHRTEVFECDIHSGCFNTRFSICCDDWTPIQLL